MSLLKNKVALITGGARGIGEAIARRYAEQGADVVFTDLKIDENAQKLEKELAAFGGRAKGYQSDASSFSDAEKLIEEIIKDFGRIDIIVNNAGITRDNLILRMTEEQWDDVIRVNLKSVFNITKNAVKHMLKARTGSIINISSVVGVQGNAGQSNYSASKAGIIGFTKSMAKEIGSRNIRCNAIAPGFIVSKMTDALTEETKAKFFAMIPMGRFGTTEEVADVAVFLGSDLSRYVTGQYISVCGGLLT